MFNTWITLQSSVSLTVSRGTTHTHTHTHTCSLSPSAGCGATGVDRLQWCWGSCWLCCVSVRRSFRETQQAGGRERKPEHHRLLTDLQLLPHCYNWCDAFIHLFFHDFIHQDWEGNTVSVHTGQMSKICFYFHSYWPVLSYQNKIKCWNRSVQLWSKHEENTCILSWWIYTLNAFKRFVYNILFSVIFFMSIPVDKESQHENQPWGYFIFHDWSTKLMLSDTFHLDFGFSKPFSSLYT